MKQVIEMGVGVAMMITVIIVGWYLFRGMCIWFA